jgi:HK97 family phage portal protein
MFNKFKEFLYKKAVQYTMMSYYGQPKWKTNKDYQYVTQAYYKVVWVYACVSLISNATSSIKWNLYRKNNNNITEIEEHPILKIVNVNANKYTTSKEFFDIWTTYLALQGKFFAIYNRSVLPTELQFLYPHQTRPIPNLQDFVSAFEYRYGGNTKKYESEIVLWSRFFDPLDVYEGLSPIKAMSRTIDTENEAVDWNKNTLQNSAVPPGAINVVNPSPELTKTLREEWKKRYAGANNARIPLVLNAEKASYTNFGMSPQDMDFLEQRKLNRIEICAGFGVPPQLVGDTETQTYSNYEQAQKAFWENTIIPKYLSDIQGVLNQDLLPRFADNLKLEPDLDSVPALQENREILIENVSKLWKVGLIKRSEGRNQLDYDFESDDDVYINEVNGTIDTDEKEKDNKKSQDDEDMEVKKKIYY